VDVAKKGLVDSFALSMTAAVVVVVVVQQNLHYGQRNDRNVLEGPSDS